MDIHKEKILFICQKFDSYDSKFFTNIIKKGKYINVLIYLKNKYNLTETDCKTILNYNFFLC